MLSSRLLVVDLPARGRQSLTDGIPAMLTDTGAEELLSDLRKDRDDELGQHCPVDGTGLADEFDGVRVVVSGLPRALLRQPQSHADATQSTAC
ncbi:hypothetical protein ASH00_14470 [Arthrobacter sp. Soil782]|uniref:hypothetical protein n=1 Tax=Arthrobacter sp. Soil782 TaxID=1736410 RepID=UPI0006FD93F3|nr:hypothetical protein [Arthrobacter sp. Soil782]KRF04306.1 hypothetical protein ASH00_14470 [Arthrobacter sp. Soil782]